MMPITPRSLPVSIRASSAPTPAEGSVEGRQRVHVAFVEHAQHDVDADHRREDEPELVRERLLRHPRHHKGHAHVVRQADVLALGGSPRRRRAARRARYRSRACSPGIARRACTSSGALCSTMLAKAESGVALPEPAIRLSRPSACGLVMLSGSASRMTRYWLVSVKMVETMLAEGAVERVVDRAGGDQARRRVAVDIDERRQALGAASLLTLRTCAELCRRCTRRFIHSVRRAVDAFQRDAILRRAGLGIRWSGPASAAG